MNGSSPLTRGKPTTVRISCKKVGLIPAHAGKTALVIGVLKARGAHPRSRGENLGEQTYNAIKAGSSPLTRGKRDQRGPRVRLLRLIPAHAGKTVQGSEPFPPSAAHPRSRGENLSITQTTLPC